MSKYKLREKSCQKNRTLFPTCPALVSNVPSYSVHCILFLKNVLWQESCCWTFSPLLSHSCLFITLLLNVASTWCLHVHTHSAAVPLVCYRIVHTNEQKHVMRWPQSGLDRSVSKHHYKIYWCTEQDKVSIVTVIWFFYTVCADISLHRSD